MSTRYSKSTCSSVDSQPLCKLSTPTLQRIVVVGSRYWAAVACVLDSLHPSDCEYSFAISQVLYKITVNRVHVRLPL
jgi:hypothetical protein